MTYPLFRSCIYHDWDDTVSIFYCPWSCVCVLVSITCSNSLNHPPCLPTAGWKSCIRNGHISISGMEFPSHNLFWYVPPQLQLKNDNGFYKHMRMANGNGLVPAQPLQRWVNHLFIFMKGTKPEPSRHLVFYCFSRTQVINGVTQYPTVDGRTPAPPAKM